MVPPCLLSFFFFFNDTATTEIYTLSLHDALPICCAEPLRAVLIDLGRAARRGHRAPAARAREYPRRRQLPRHSHRSEEHTSELQSQSNLVCRLLLEKKKNRLYISIFTRSSLFLYS